MDGIDPQTKKYVGADVMLKKQIAEVQADAKMPAADKKQALAELNDALKSIDPVKNPGNIELVLKILRQARRLGAAAEVALAPSSPADSRGGNRA